MKPNCPPEDDPTSIGNILVSMGLLDAETLRSMVEEFRSAHDEMLGEFLVRRLGISESHVELALLRQHRLRGGNGSSTMFKALEISKRSQQRITAKVEEVAVAASMFKDVKR